MKTIYTILSAGQYIKMSRKNITNLYKKNQLYFLHSLRQSDQLCTSVAIIERDDDQSLDLLGMIWASNPKNLKEILQYAKS